MEAAELVKDQMHTRPSKAGLCIPLARHACGGAHGPLKITCGMILHDTQILSKYIEACLE